MVRVWVRWLGALTLLLILAGGASAQGQGASAGVSPSTSQPGEDIELIFEIPSPDDVEIVVQERVNCTLTFPDGTTRSPCDRPGGLIEVRTNGSGGASYRVPYQAPATFGTYEVLFEAEDTARVPPQTYRAEATFQVTDAPTGQAQEPPGGDGQPPEEATDGPDTSDDGTSGSQAGDGALATLAPRSDDSRILVSTGLSASVVSAALVANRWPIGGG